MYRSVLLCARLQHSVDGSTAKCILYFHEVIMTDGYMLRSVIWIIGIKRNTESFTEVTCLWKKFVEKNKPIVPAQDFLTVMMCITETQQPNVCILLTHLTRMTTCTLFSAQGYILLPTAIPARTYVQSLRLGAAQTPVQRINTEVTFAHH